jgi:hypothetical protein
MKKNLIISLFIGFFLMSCKNNNMQPVASSVKTAPKFSVQLSRPDMSCKTYSIFNPHAPTGPTVLYSCIDCIGGVQTGSIDPRVTINILAQPGTVKCPGGVVTEIILKPQTAPDHLRP